MKYTKYIVVEAIRSYSFRLNIPPGIYDVFYSYNRPAIILVLGRLIAITIAYRRRR